MGVVLSFFSLQPDQNATAIWVQMKMMKPMMMSHPWNSDSSLLWPTASARYLLLRVYAKEISTGICLYYSLSL